MQDHFSLAWHLGASFGPLQGAGMREIFDRYIQAEWRSDWDKAKAEHGDALVWPICPAAMRSGGRTPYGGSSKMPPQRNPGRCRPATPTPSSGPQQPTKRCWPGWRDGTPRPFNLDTYRCETLDGHPLDPTEAAANALIGRFRRAIVDSAGVVIDLSRARRLTGGARLAVMLESDRCVWPGCEVAVSRCEIDHAP